MSVISSKQIAMPLRIYRWNKYSADSSTQTTKSISAGSRIQSETAHHIQENKVVDVTSFYHIANNSGSSYTPSFVHDVCTSAVKKTTTSVTGTVYIQLESWIYEDDECYTQSESKITQYTVPSGTTFTVISDYSYSSGGGHLLITYVTANKSIEEVLSTPIVTYHKGSTNYGLVESTNVEAFPDNGYKDGYWYVRV